MTHNAEAVYSRNIFGFWVYIMSDCVLFSCLFATYAVLHPQTFGGPSGQQLFHPPLFLTQTIVLLVSSFTSGLANIAAARQSKGGVLGLLAITWLLGATFLGLELHEFTDFVHQGYSWTTSAFLTSFFSLVGTHGGHITAGLIWMAFMMVQIGMRGIDADTLRRHTCLSIFWHFLDVVWIFIFTIVYLMGVVGL